MKSKLNQKISIPLMLILWSFLSGYMFKEIDWLSLYSHFFNQPDSYAPSTPSPRTPTQHTPRGIYSNNSNRIEVKCPSEETAIIIVGFGQSNSANAQGQRYKASSNQIINFHNGKCYKAVDPMLGATGKRGSIWIPVAEKITTDKPIVLVTFGVGGSSISEWLDENTLSNFYQSNRDSFRTAYSDANFVIWIQGESDKNTHPKLYKSQLKTWLNEVSKDFNTARLLITGTSYCNGTGNEKIVSIQKEVAEDLDALYLGDTDKFNNFNDRYDDCHFSPSGVEKVSTLISNHINNIIN